MNKFHTVTVHWYKTFTLSPNEMYHSDYKRRNFMSVSTYGTKLSLLLNGHFLSTRFFLLKNFDEQLDIFLQAHHFHNKIESCAKK